MMDLRVRCRDDSLGLLLGKIWRVSGGMMLKLDSE
jgi:hypothetical protein